jgi:protein-glutamine gamma-glutamyltransferase
MSGTAAPPPVPPPPGGPASSTALWRPLAGRPAPGSEGPDDPVLRAAVLVVHLSATAALVGAGLLPLAVALVTAPIAIGLSLLARACLTRRSLNPLRIGLWTATALLTLVAPFVLAPAGLPTPVVLGVFVAGFLAATSADQDGTRRAMLMNLVLGLAVLGLGAGLGPVLQPSTGPALALPVVAGWAAALVVLARASRRQAGSGVRARVAPDPGGRRVPPPARAASAGVVAVTMAVSLLAFAVVTHLPDGSATQDGFAQAPDGGGLLGDPTSPEPQPRSVRSTYSGGSLDLRSRGDLPEEPVMLVPADSPALWRSATLDVYTGRAWLQTTLPEGPFRRVTGTFSVERADDPPPAGAATRTDRVRWLAPGSFAVPRPGVARTVTLAPPDAAGVAADGTVFHAHGGSGSHSDDDVGYSVTSAGRASTDPREAAASGAGPDALRAAAAFPRAGGDAQAAYLDLPDGVPQRVRDLAAEVTAGATSRYDAVRAVEDHLRARAVYTLDAPVPGDGDDAVDHFLFESREGFCEQFASAEVVLLRALGVPARMAVGFAGGERALGPDGAPADPALAGDLAGQRLVRGTQAHAWVEVWFPGTGWVSSDPTAGTRLADPSAADRLLDWLTENVVLAVVLLAVLLLAAVGVGVLVSRRRSDAPAAVAGGLRAGGEAAALLAAFDRLEAALAHAGAPRTPGETLAELGERLRRGDARAGVVDEDVARLGLPGPVGALGVLERLLYAAAPPPPVALRAAAEGLDAVTARVLASLRTAR